MDPIRREEMPVFTMHDPERERERESERERERERERQTTIYPLQKEDIQPSFRISFGSEFVRSSKTSVWTWYLLLMTRFCLIVIFCSLFEFFLSIWQWNVAWWWCFPHFGNICSMKYPEGHLKIVPLTCTRESKSEKPICLGSINRLTMNMAAIQLLFRCVFCIVCLLSFFVPFDNFH